MSAKWRRNKTNSKRPDIWRVFKQVKSKDTAREFRVENSVKRADSTVVKVRRVSAGEKIREPRHLVDVLEGADEITVVADLAGFRREDLKVHVRGERLTLIAVALDRKYRKSLNLPKRVISNTLRTTYKNGVLEIRLKKIEEKSVHKVAG